ncbi:MAG TPA: WG repeat-containing protein [Bacteroidia bacterium]|nr:WG repeat-containing protein [Bacteroidia bacterium]
MRILLFLLLTSVLFLTSCGHDPGKYRACAKLHDQYGYIDETGDFVIDPDFDVAWSFIRGTAVVKNDGKYGLIDKMGDWVIEPVYDSMIPFSATCFIIMKDSAFGFAAHGTGEILIAPQYEQVYKYYTDDLCVVQKGRALGVVDPYGKLTCPPVLQHLEERYGPLATVVQSDTTIDEMAMLMHLIDESSVKLGLMNERGEYVTPCKYDEMFDDAQHGYYYPFLRAAEYVNDSVIGGVPIMIGTYGIVDTSGKILVEPVFNEMPVYGDGMFRVRIGEKYGYADASGKVVIEPQWEFAVAFSEGKALVSEKSNSSIIDKTGKVLASNLGPGTGMYRFMNNRARCRSLDGKYGYMDPTGKRVIPPTYEVADDFVNGVAIVGTESKYGLIDTTGKILVEPKYSLIFNLGDGYYEVKDEQGKAGVITSAGEMIIQMQYSDIFHLQKNYFMVDVDGLNGCFDITGRQIFPPSSIVQLFFVDGKSLVSKDNRFGMIDSTGKYVVPAEYDSIGYFFKGYTTVVKNGVYGALDSTGKVIAQPKYTELRPFVNGFAVFREKSKYGYINLKGEVVIEARFEDAAVLVDPDRREFE